MHARGAGLSVCVVTQQYEHIISGIGLHATNLISHLLADGHKVTVITPGQNYKSLPEDLPFTLVTVPRPLFAATQARWFTLSWNFSRCLRDLERNLKFDVIHFTDARESLFTYTTAPLIGNVNDTYAAEVGRPKDYRLYYNDWLVRWAYYRLAKFCEASAYPRVQGLIANSQYTARVLMSKYLLAPERVFVCYKSIELPESESASIQNRSDTTHPPRVLFVGGNMQRKGLPTLISAASRVISMMPDIEFWVVGDDKAVPHLKSMCAENGVLDNFHFWGWCSQEVLHHIYLESNIFVMPSLIEAFGVVFLEAMARGLPVIATAVGGIPELIQHEHNGLLISPGDIEGLADSIVRLFADEGLRHRLQSAGLETVQNYTVERMMDCTYGIYQTVMENR